MGVNDSGAVVEGGKLNDNVLHGDWSLMANNENTGEILKTSPGAIPFKSGHEYRVSFDYQTTHANQFRVRLGTDVAHGASFTTTNLVSEVLGQQHTTATWSGTFDAVGCGDFFIAIDKLAGANHQHNMTIDHLRVEDLGLSDAVSEPCVSGNISVEGGTTIYGSEPLTVTTVISSFESSEVTEVEHDLVVPAGWAKELVTAGAATLNRGDASVATWLVTPPTTPAAAAVLELQGSAGVNGETVEFESEINLNMISDDDVFLSDLGRHTDRYLASESNNGWGPVEWDLSNGEQALGDGTPISLRGTVYDKGLGTHADANTVFDLAGLECTAFQAIVGIDDIQGGRGSVTFSVYGDGELLAGPTAELVGNGPTHTFFVDITGVEKLRLHVNKGADNGNDHADWALARVTCAEGPDFTAPSVSQIGDQSVVEGAEFSLQVQATDASLPLTYAADGLPEGITIDAATGLISGTPTAAGTFNVKVTVTDAAGNSAQVSFSLVVKAKTTPTTPPTEKPGVEHDLPYIYYTPGKHTFNGRQWMTTCEPYSQTFRCRTEIWATVITYENGQFVNNTGWHFNNLTYLPSSRALWANNPLGHTNHWTSDEGRQWYTECDTAATGRGACRSYIRTQVVVSTPKVGGGYTYSIKTDWVFNNMVLFSN